MAKALIKAKIRQGRILHRRWTSHKQAKAALQQIEQNVGKTDPALVKQSVTYASDVFGNSHYAPWLIVYSAFNSEFKEGWIPDDFYGEVVVPKLKGDYGEVSMLKPISNRLLKTDLFPDIAYYVNGLFISLDGSVIPKQEITEILFNNTDRIIFKLDKSYQGKGIYVIDKKVLNIDKILQLGNGVFQTYIQQHSFFSEFTPNAVATLRVTTIIDDLGLCRPRASYLRIANAKETHVQSATSINVPVSIENGVMHHSGYQNWKPLTTHPDSRQTFKDKQIPRFDKCLSTVVNIHQQFPFARSIGWDLTVDKESQVKVMEWNGPHNDIKFSEATTGPCFSDLQWEKL